MDSLSCFDLCQLPPLQRGYDTGTRVLSFAQYSPLERMRESTVGVSQLYYFAVSACHCRSITLRVWVACSLLVAEMHIVSTPTLLSRILHYKSAVYLLHQPETLHDQSQRPKNEADTTLIEKRAMLHSLPSDIFFSLTAPSVYFFATQPEILLLLSQQRGRFK